MSLDYHFLLTCMTYLSFGAKDIQAMSREAREEGKEPLPVEQKGNAMSHYTLANQCSTLCSTMLRL